MAPCEGEGCSDAPTVTARGPLSQRGSRRLGVLLAAPSSYPHEVPLHVTNGDSAAITLRETSVEGAVLPWRDVLNEGPLLREGFNEARAAFLSASGWGDER